MRRNTGILSQHSIGFLAEEVRKRVTKRRFRHSLSVAKTAESLALAYGAPAKKAYVAGLLHDIARDLPPGELVSIAREFGIPVGPLEVSDPVLLHSGAAAVIARRELWIRDNSILKAIWMHTTGGVSMSTLDLILYISDYIEPERPMRGIEEIWEVALRDLEAAALIVMNSTIEYLLGKKRPIHPRTIRARNRLILRMDQGSLIAPVGPNEQI